MWICLVFLLAGKSPKKEMDTVAAEAFWGWFEEQEMWVIDCLEKSDTAFVWAIDERLKPVFPYFKGELEFQLGYNDGIYEFYLYNFGIKRLMRDSEKLGEMMPLSLKDRWEFICEE